MSQIWSVRFSGDGRELVAGTSDSSVYVFDLDANRSILRIPGHNDDVNAVCFGDVSSPHILYSGSDDTLIKVWDRRSMGDSREAGVFMGHTEGLTYVDSKGDGRYVLSNGKDQTMKLWDLRKMMSTEQSAKINPSDYSSAFDYRYMSYSDIDYTPHEHDCSLVTYHGHSVLKTLIRCHFSPPGSTNSRYVYSGSEDGKVHIYNLDATSAGTIDVTSATLNSRPREPQFATYSWEDGSNRNNWKTCVRDVSWHPHAPVIAGKFTKCPVQDLTNFSKLLHGMDGACQPEPALSTVGTMGLQVMNRMSQPRDESTISLNRILLTIIYQQKDAQGALVCGVAWSRGRTAMMRTAIGDSWFPAYSQDVSTVHMGMHHGIF